MSKAGIARITDMGGDPAPGERDRLGELVQAVCNVMDEVGYVQKTGRNKDQNYNFASDADLLRKIQPAMAKHGLALVPAGADYETVEAGKTRSGATWYRTTVKVTYLLLHTSGANLVLESVGSGQDTQDKGPYKALTGAYKYILRQTFAIPTGDDAENDHGDDSGNRPTARKPTGPKLDDKGHDPEWDDDRAWFHANLGEEKMPYEHVKGWHLDEHGAKPSAIGHKGRQRLLDYLATPKGRRAVHAWVDAQNTEPAHPGPGPDDDIPF